MLTMLSEVGFQATYIRDSKKPYNTTGYTSKAKPLKTTVTTAFIVKLTQLERHQQASIEQC